MLSWYKKLYKLIKGCLLWATDFAKDRFFKHICVKNDRSVQRVRVTRTHSYRDFLHRDFFTLAIESYEVFPTTALGYILQSVNQAVQYMSDAGHRYA